MSFKVDRHGIMTSVGSTTKKIIDSSGGGWVWIQFVVYNCSRMISDLVVASYRSCRENDNSYQVPVNIGFRLFMVIWGILEERERERERVGVQKICMIAAVQGKLSS
jgi:hypothetical protein